MASLRSERTSSHNFQCLHDPSSQHYMRISIQLLFLKITTDSLSLCLLKVTPYVSVDFSWEMGEGKEQDFCFDWPSVQLKQQKKNYNYHIDNYSLHISPQTQKITQQQKASHRPEVHTCKPLSACRQTCLPWPPGLRKAGCLPSRAVAIQKAACHQRHLHPEQAHLRHQAEQNPCEEVIHSQRPHR